MYALHCKQAATVVQRKVVAAGQPQCWPHTSDLPPAARGVSQVAASIMRQKVIASSGDKVAVVLYGTVSPLRPLRPLCTVGCMCPLCMLRCCTCCTYALPCAQCMPCCHACGLLLCAAWREHGMQRSVAMIVPCSTHRLASPSSFAAREEHSVLESTACQPSPLLTCIACALFHSERRARLMAAGRFQSARFTMHFPCAVCSAAREEHGLRRHGEHVGAARAGGAGGRWHPAPGELWA